MTAKDNATGKDQKITITSSSGLSKEEVERMAKDADAHAAEDRSQRDSIEAKNQLDSMVYNVEKMLKEHGDKISGWSVAMSRTLWLTPKRRWNPATRVKWKKRAKR